VTSFEASIAKLEKQLAAAKSGDEAKLSAQLVQAKELLAAARSGAETLN
jgi:hypothetical protein